jgi:hypothetical protein
LNEKEIIFGKEFPIIATLIKRTFHSSKPVLSPTEAHGIRFRYQKMLEAHTNGAYKSGHMVATDINQTNVKGEVPMQGNLTTGAGSKQNPSTILYTTGNIKGGLEPQRIVVQKIESKFPKMWLRDNGNSPVPGSKEFFERVEVENNMKKHSPSFRPTTNSNTSINNTPLDENG